MAKCVVSTLHLCDRFAKRLPASDPSSRESESAVDAAISAASVVRSEFQDVGNAPFLEGVWIVVCES